MELTVGASDAKDAKDADFRCDGIADNVEIQSAIDLASKSKIQTRFGHIAEFPQMQEYFSKRYQLTEERIIAATQYVALDQKNANTFSLEFASLLRDSASTFSSVMDILTRKTSTKKSRHYFKDYRKFLVGEVTNIHTRSVTVNDLFPMIIIPYSAFSDPIGGIPRWWTAYNNIKHREVTLHRDGNLANSFTALAALAIIGNELGCFIRTKLFVNVGITYPPNDPSIAEDNILFN
jgi:hypothetical protein